MTHWLMAQGYRLSKLPPVVTWYAIDKSTGMEREFRGRTDDYTLNLNRAKGFVLARKYLDPQLWHELEYVLPSPTLAVKPSLPVGKTPRLAKAIREAMIERDFWEGTATELLSMIELPKVGIPKDAIRLSTRVMEPNITNALKTYDLTVGRRRTDCRRLLVFSR